MGREIVNPRKCAICGAEFDWPVYGVVLDVRVPGTSPWTLELDTCCAQALVNEIRGQAEELLFFV